jgi:hypothetical protein
MTNNTIRVRTTPNGGDNYINIKVEQDIDFIEILSLNISQDKIYENFCSDYGVVVGRVIINNGFGVPNAKVSIFIPIDSVDKESTSISGLYPYETVTDKNSTGVRYNLLPKESDSQDSCYTPVGTFPAKREILDNEEMLYVYKKYYKYTTQTNYAGDFMIFGVPVGTHIIHVDMDISNIGIASQRPYDLIEQGAPQKIFSSPTKFKDSKNLNSLPQIKTANASVNVRPFWGDLETCQIGINRLDFDMNYSIKPAAYFMGGLFGDNEKNSVNKNCRPRKKMGRICEQMAGEGTIQMIRKTIDNDIERFDIDGGRVIDNNGAWAYQIPMNLDYVVTDEYGKLIPSEDPNIGIPTRSSVRFKIGMDASGGIGRLRTKANYLVPHNPKNLAELDFTFGTDTKDSSFIDIHWNKIYTVKNFIPKMKKQAASSTSQNYVGIKDVDACVGDKNPFPFNRTYASGDILFFIICLFVNIIELIAATFNILPLCIFCSALCLPFGIGCPLCGLVPPISLGCTTDDGEACSFTPSFCGGNEVGAWRDCIEAVLANKLNLFQFDFYNDWVNGSLYFYLLKYKHKRNGKDKFCDYKCEQDGSTNSCTNNSLSDTTFDSQSSSREITFSNGLITKYNNELFYSPILSNGDKYKLFATDITNLGAVYDCDWQGFPKIIQYITPTSYKLPPLLPEASTDDNITNLNVGGMFTIRQGCGGGILAGDGLFFDVTCFGVTHDSRQAINIRRLCELGVDIPESTSLVPTTVGISAIYNQNDISDVETSIQRYTRDAFTLLNIGGAGISSYPQYLPDNETYLKNLLNGTSFAYDDISGNIVSHNNGGLYNQFRNYSTNSDDTSFQALDNSYYLYFGPVPGKNGLDKLNSKYFTTCVKKNLDDYIIKTNVTNTSSNSNSDGSIIFTFIGGTGPFTYNLTGVNTQVGPISTLNSGTITGLTTGTYLITAVDLLGTIVTKEVLITGPQILRLSASSSIKPSTAMSSDGVIDIVDLYGGTTPYTLKIMNSTGTYNKTYNNANTQISPINGISAGTYTITVIDSSIPQQTVSVVLNIVSQPALNIGDPNIQNSKCFCQAAINPSTSFISGGFPPYVLELKAVNPINGTSAYYNGSQYTGKTITLSGVSIGSTVSQFNLCEANYTVKVTDSRGSTKSIAFDLTCDAKARFTAVLSSMITFNSGVLNGTTGQHWYDENDNPLSGNFYEIIPSNNIGAISKASPKLYTARYKVLNNTILTKYLIKDDGTNSQPKTVTINDDAGCRYVINN